MPGTGGSTTYKYDPFGRRVQKAVTVNSLTTTTNYIYDGANILEELDTSGHILARYSQGAGIDQPLAELRSGTTSFYEGDGIGSITSLSNSAAAVANTYTYKSFGKLSASTGTITNPFQYTARDLDTESALSYDRARYYDPSAGRFLTEDPVGFAGGINFYRYVGNNPVNFVDPLGLDGHTWGPFSWYTNQQGMSPAQIAAEKAHETQHRADFWNGNVFTKSCEFIESRGFAAEIPLLNQRIQELTAKKCLSDSEKKELHDLEDDLDRARTLGDSKGGAIRYYCQLSK